MENDVIEEKRDFKLRRLADFCTQASLDLGFFLLNDEKTTDLGDLNKTCKNIEEIFQNVFFPKSSLKSSPRWYDSSEILRYLYSTFSNPNEPPQKMSARVINMVRAVRWAEHIVEVRHKVIYLREHFYNLGQTAREGQERHELEVH